jgi:hypothetical protein
MRVSFDIDDTLVRRGDHFPCERTLLPGFIHRRLGESLRSGTRSLFHELRRRGCDIWIYTSSERSRFHIRFWMALHALRIDGVVNGFRHRREMSGRAFSRSPSKYPPAFGIDLHIDDSEGVRLEGLEHNFEVLVIDPDDNGWSGKILNFVSRKTA